MNIRFSEDFVEKEEKVWIILFCGILDKFCVKMLLKISVFNVLVCFFFIIRNVFGLL